MKRTVTTVLLLATTLTASGCVSWRRQNASPAEVLADPKVEVVRVITSNQTPVIVYQPRIVNDTLSGLPTEMAIQRVHIAVSDIAEVATRYRHIGKTLLAGIAIIGGVAVYGLLQSLNTF
jgi:hypothetical protein